MIKEKLICNTIDNQEQLPDRLINSITALNHKIRRQIIYLLDERNTAFFSEIVSKLKLPKRKAEYHLKILSLAGLIDRKLKQVNDEFESYYELTDFTNRIITNLLKSLYP